MHRLRHYVKLLIATMLMYTGLLRAIAWWRLRNKLVILTYHRVLDRARRSLSHSTDGIVVSDSTFDHNLTQILRYFRLISIDELIDYVNGDQTFPSRSCLITFDDGWLDNYDIAFPIIAKHAAPVTIFIPVAYIDSARLFWQEELMMLLTALCESGDNADSEFLRELLPAETELTAESFRNFVTRLKDVNFGTVEGVLENTRSRLKVRTESEHYNKYVSWNQILEMQRSSVSFGSHSVSHRRMTSLSETDCEAELVDSKRDLERRLERTIQSMAYPNGDYNAKLKQQVANTGYKVAFTTRKGHMDHDTDFFAIPRINIHESCASNKAIFLCTVLDLF